MPYLAWISPMYLRAGVPGGLALINNPAPIPGRLEVAWVGLKHKHGPPLPIDSCLVDIPGCLGPGFSLTFGYHSSYPLGLEVLQEGPDSVCSAI
ncbi:hypothetical protein DSO57_1030411 [Entomophthora muscae]|uniref:Uncharacterized protein n=1 Tax=Entomophthora muscae TaxID=34485 RepID=A0ACC2TMZ3_9FUNG|nr:hypothetical protein DSO57_1030411 [Entomophthora muscae]